MPMKRSWARRASDRLSEHSEEETSAATSSDELGYEQHVHEEEALSSEARERALFENARSIRWGSVDIVEGYREGSAGRRLLRRLSSFEDERDERRERENVAFEEYERQQRSRQKRLFCWYVALNLAILAVSLSTEVSARLGSPSIWTLYYVAVVIGVLYVILDMWLQGGRLRF
jgi:hypothetical protein